MGSGVPVDYWDPATTWGTEYSGGQGTLPPSNWETPRNLSDYGGTPGRPSCYCDVFPKKNVFFFLFVHH